MTAPAPTDSSDKEEIPTTGVSILTGDPKRAILKLSGPLIIAMLIMSVYNFSDAVWVAGLGPGALAGVGFVTPIYQVLIALCTGISAGVSSAVARRIGAKDKTEADNTAMHALLLTAGASVIFTTLFLLFLRPTLLAIGAADSIDPALEYGYVLFGGTVFFLFTNVGYGILRAEGDMKRTMHAMVASSVINMILDPILIYGMGLGMTGAALSTIISIALVSAVLVWWLWGKHDTYVTIHRSAFHYRPAVIRDILNVGLPASGEMLLMAGVSVILNLTIVTVGGTDGMAIYTGGWRVVLFAIVPMSAIGMALISVAGALYGAQRFDELKIVHRYAAAVGIAIAIIITILTWMLAPSVAMLFAFAPETAHLLPDITAFIRTMCFLFPFIPLGIVSVNLLQGMGKGLASFIVAVLWNVVCIASCTYLLAIPLGLGEHGAWWGIVLGVNSGAVIAYGAVAWLVERVISKTDETDHTTRT